MNRVNECLVRMDLVSVTSWAIVLLIVSCRTELILRSRVFMASTDVVTEPAFLDSVEGEIWFFKSIMHARPVGKHRHFHVMSMRNTILRETGQSVAIDDIWNKLKTCYDLDALEAIVRLDLWPTNS